ncbi:MAG TPA: tripartite tricarboxylate transporter TctB family protein [Gammaproteobacteria bacterium]|nr:tripartite tricarboxylate transporter TctB family protein [Gammaproteobacteria bacterium]
MKQDSPKQPRNILPEFIIPAMALGFTIYYMTTITGVPWISQASAIVVGSLLTLSILAFVVRSVLRIRRGEETLELRDSWHILLGRVPVSGRRIGLLALAIGYVWVIDRLGFTLTTFVFVFAAIVLLSSLANWKRALAVSVSSAVVGYVVFVYFFNTRFPSGPIEDWLKGLL